jgi:hypothetical protein
MTARRTLEFRDDPAEAVAALDDVGAGRGWCNLTPEVAADDVEVLTVSVFSMKMKRGAPIATYVSSPARKGEPQPGTLGVLHTRGRLGKERISTLLDGAPFALRQDHTQRGLLLDVPAATESRTVLSVMCSLLTALCDYERTGTWRLDVFERAGVPRS